MTIELTRWTPADVPRGPYLHGSRTEYSEGDRLHVRPVLEEDPDPERVDLREMCFATIDFDAALDWGLRRCRSRGPVVYVYEVELDDVEVDTNAHGIWREYGPATSVMAPVGVVKRIHATAAELVNGTLDPDSVVLW